MPSQLNLNTAGSKLILNNWRDAHTFTFSHQMGQCIGVVVKVFEMDIALLVDFFFSVFEEHLIS